MAVQSLMQQQQRSSVASRVVVIVTLVVIVGAFVAILWRSITSMGGYEWAFDANKSATEARIRAEQQAALASPGVGAGEDAVVAADEPKWSLHFYDAANTRADLPRAAPSRLVIVVHGLDDPGWILGDLIDALVGEGWAVVRFDYPNDHAIARSADYLAEALRLLHQRGVEEVDIVAHSMGGLVARDALTRPSIYAGNGSGTGELPAVDRLIMLGTPNLGSQFSRLRAISEIGEQISRAWQGNQQFFAFLEEGAGEAGRDLLPGSAFLRDLNNRPNPAHTTMTIIAGTASPINADAASGWIDTVDLMIDRDSLPAWLRDRVDRLDTESLKNALRDAIGAVGDGVVSLDSAKLEGVDDFQIIEADHLSMVANLLRRGERPAAIPIVLERLRD